MRKGGPRLFVAAALCAARTAFADPTGSTGLAVHQAQIGTVVDFGPTLIFGSTLVVPAVSGGGERGRATVWNGSAAGSGTLWCRADGSAAVVGVGQQITPQSAYEWDAPTAGTAAIYCISGSGALQASGEYSQ